MFALLLILHADPAPSYYKDVRPLMVQHCQGCHQPAKAQGGYVMTDFASLIKAGESGKATIVPGKPDESELITQVHVKDGKALMPKNREPLTEKQIQSIRAWIAAGAKDDTPLSAKRLEYDADHPPVYTAQPVVSSIAASADVLAVSGYHEVLLHKVDGSGLVGRLVGLSERVQSLAFSPDGKLLAAAGGSPGRFGELQLWDVAKQKLKWATTISFDTLYGVSWSPDGKIIAVGCSDNTVRGLDAENGKPVLQMGTHSDWVLGTTFSQDGLHLASVSRDMTVKLTEVAEQRFVDNVTSITPGVLKGGLICIDRRPMKEKKLQKVPDDTPGAKAQAYDELLFAGSDGVPRLYKMHRETKRVIGDDANKMKEFEAMPGRVSSIRFNSDGTKFVAGSSLDGNGAVWIYDAEKNSPVKCEKISGPVYAVCWNGDGVASAGFDGAVWLHDAAGKLVKSFAAAPTK